MKTLKGPGIFLSQYIDHQAPFNSLPAIASWAANLGLAALQMPCSCNPGIFDLALAAESQAYCDEVKGILTGAGLQIAELSTRFEGQLVAVHPSNRQICDAFAPKAARGDDTARRAWAKSQLLLAAKASRNLGLNAHATFSGALVRSFPNPCPQRPSGLMEEAFSELASCWIPILNAFDEAGVDVCFELHPRECIHDGATYERFLDLVNQHARAKILYDPSHLLVQGIDYLQFIDLYHPLIRAFHVKDAELRPIGSRFGYGSYQSWIERPGRFRSLGEGQIDLGAIFSKLAQFDYEGWAILEWEACIQNPEEVARLGAAFIRRNILRVTERAAPSGVHGRGGESNQSILVRTSCTSII